MMKKIVSIVFFATCLLPTAYSQVKAVKATSEKIVGGVGGIFMHYVIGLENKSADSLVIDSVKTIAGGTAMRYSFRKTEKAYCELVLSYALTEPPKCRTCPDIGSQQVNLTKGVRIYYKKGKKRSVLKVKKFKKLEDKIMP